MNTMKDIVTLLSKTQPLSPTLRWAESISPAVSTISTVKTTAPHELVSLKATVKHISGTKMINMDNGTLKKCSCMLQDTTGTIEAVFFYFIYFAQITSIKN